MTNKKYPVVILNGFLGSGKTTLLRNLIIQSHERGLSICVIVNDMSELDVDGEIIANTDFTDSENCTFESIHSDVLSSPTGIQKLNDALLNILSVQSPDLVLIETSGSCHPLPLVEYFRNHEQLNLTGMLTLADSAMLAQDFVDGQQLIPRLQFNLQNQRRDTVNLLVEQILFCNYLFMTKADKLEGDRVQKIAQLIHPINPYVSISSLPFGRLSIDDVLNFPSYDFQKVDQLIQELKPTVEQEESETSSRFDMETRVIKDERPFHPQRLWETCQQYLGDKVYRSKGFFWLASRDKISLLWNQASGSISLELVGYWRSGILEDTDNGLEESEIKFLKQRLAKQEGRFGDRHCHVTVIGDKSQVDLFTTALKTCFLTEEEIEHWQKGGTFADPWPKRLLKM